MDGFKGQAGPTGTNAAQPKSDWCSKNKTKKRGGRGPRVRQVVLGPASGNTTQPRIWASEPGQTTDGFSRVATAAAAEALCV